VITLTYLAGWLYERLVNTIPAFAPFRVLLIAVLRRPQAGPDESEAFQSMSERSGGRSHRVVWELRPGCGITRTGRVGRGRRVIGTLSHLKRWIP
jgi:hypothetical protein